MTDTGRQRWFITGVSGGIGREIARSALERGDQVAGSVRSAADADRFAALAPGRAHPVLLDVTDPKRIPAAVDEAIRALGGLDVLVNNAGRAIVGAAEEMTESEIRMIYEINVFGLLGVIRAALPHMRAQRRGRIVNISSAGGQMAFPGISIYCSTKFAVEGLSEALAGELAPFGIHVMVVDPGAFRTNFSGASIALPAHPMATYDGTPGGFARAFPAQLTGKEMGDPARAAAAILEALAWPEPPQRLILGSDAIKTVGFKIDALTAQVEACRAIASTTDFAGEKAFDFRART